MRALFPTLASLGFSLALGASFASPAWAQDPGPDATAVSIGSFTYGGSACPGGSVAANISPDAKALTLLFDSWVVETDSTPAPVVVKQCRIDLKLVAPAGWRYAILGLDYRGFADLEGGVRAEQVAAYRFNGGQQGSLKPLSLVGPMSTNYINSTAIDLAALPWSSCGGDMTLTIDTSSKIERPATTIERQVNLSSSQMRRAEQDIGAGILDMQVMHRDSSSPCQAGRSFGFAGTKAWVNLGCRATFKIVVPGPVVQPPPRGMLTVDSIDGELRQNYGIAWQQCTPGRWVQANGVNAQCAQVCAAQGLRSGRDSGGAACASGESRPSSAIGRIAFTQGCWGNGCASMGAIPTSEAPGGTCYMPGQKHDNDKTDRTVGCYCY